MEEVVKKVTELIKSNKTVVLIVLALIGILLITASGLFQKTDDKKESDVFDEKIYIDNLEKRIGEMALVTKQIMPQIGGVTVVCDGGADASVKASVINAVCTVLNIGANKVCVIAKAN